MNVVFCDKRDCLFWDVDGICNCVMHDGIPYCKSESIDTKNDAADGLKEENAKLRELVLRYVEYTSQDRCEGCVFKLRCNDGYVDECWRFAEIRGLARELGIEVDA